MKTYLGFPKLDLAHLVFNFLGFDTNEAACFWEFRTAVDPRDHTPGNPVSACFPKLCRSLPADSLAPPPTTPPLRVLSSISGSGGTLTTSWERFLLG